MKFNKLIGRIALLCGLTLVTLSSCKKEEVDVTGPVITFEEPTMAMYTIDSTSGSVEVPIKITITDDAELHEVGIELDNVTDNSEIFHLHKHVDAESYTLDTTITFSYSMMKDHTISVEAEDHSGNISTDTKDFHVHVE